MTEEKDFHQNDQAGQNDGNNTQPDPEHAENRPTDGSNEEQAPEEVPDVEAQEHDEGEEISPETREHPTAERVISHQDRFLAALAHFCILALLPAVQVPLLIWLLEKDKPTRAEYVVFNAKQACVFQLFVLAAIAVLYITIVLIPIAIIIGVAAWIYGIIGGIQSARGERFSYIWVGDFVRDWK